MKKNSSRVTDLGFIVLPVKFSQDVLKESVLKIIDLQSMQWTRG